MNGESRARGRHNLLFLGTRKLPKYRLCYSGGGLDCQRVHEHARRRGHFARLSKPVGYDSDYKATTRSILLCVNMSAHCG